MEFYFIRVACILELNMLRSKDKILIETYGNEKIFCLKTDKRIPRQELEKINIGPFLRKLRTTASIEHTPEAVGQSRLGQQITYTGLHIR